MTKTFTNPLLREKRRADFYQFICWTVVPSLFAAVVFLTMHVHRDQQDFARRTSTITMQQR